MGSSCCVPIGADIILDPFGKLTYDPYDMKIHRKTAKVTPANSTSPHHLHHKNSRSSTTKRSSYHEDFHDVVKLKEDLKKEGKKINGYDPDDVILPKLNLNPSTPPKQPKKSDYFTECLKNKSKEHLIVTETPHFSPTKTAKDTVVVKGSVNLGDVINVPNLPFAKHIDFKLTPAGTKKLEKNHSLPSLEGLKPRPKKNFEKKFSFRNLSQAEDTFKTFYTDYVPKIPALKNDKFEFLVLKRVLKIHKIERKCYEALKSLKNRFDFSKVEDPAYVETLLSPLSPNTSSSSDTQITPKNGPPISPSFKTAIDAKRVNDEDEDPANVVREQPFSRKGFPTLEINIKTVKETRRDSDPHAKSNPRMEEPTPSQSQNMDPNTSSALLLAFLVEKPFLKLVQETPENLEKELELRRLVEKPKSPAVILSEKGHILKWNRHCERILEIRTMSNELKTFTSQYLEYIKSTSLFWKEAAKLKKKINAAKDDKVNDNIDKRKRSIYSFKEFAYCVKETEDYFMAELTLLHSLTKTEFSRFLIPKYEEWKANVEKTLSAVIEMANIYKSTKEIPLKRLVTGDIVQFASVFEPFSTENGEIVILARLTPIGGALSWILSSPRLMSNSPNSSPSRSNGSFEKSNIPSPT